MGKVSLLKNKIIINKKVEPSKVKLKGVQILDGDYVIYIHGEYITVARWSSDKIILSKWMDDIIWDGKTSLLEHCISKFNTQVKVYAKMLPYGLYDHDNCRVEISGCDNREYLITINKQTIFNYKVSFIDRKKQNSFHNEKLLGPIRRFINKELTLEELNEFNY